MERSLQGWWSRAISIVAVSLVLFQLYTAGAGLLPDMRQRAVHVAFGLALTLALMSPLKSGRSERRIPVWDLLLIGVVIVSCVNVYIKYVWLLEHTTESTTLDLVLGVALTLIVMEAGRRTVGWTFPILTGALLLYAFVGGGIPGRFGHPPYSFEMVVQRLYQGQDAIWGFITGISATMVAIFIIFGAFLLFTGAGQTFIEIAVKLVGRLRGGPALSAVVASAAFGSVSGSSVANVATTGNFTIPLMKRLGYRSEFAGGVEATASSAGQITPPIMGAAAFIMAEFLCIPYLNVVVAAIIPAFLFYLGVFAGVRFESLKSKMPPIPAELILPWREIITWPKLSPLIPPVIVLLLFLLRGYTPVTAGFWACATALVFFLFSKPSPSGVIQNLKKMIYGFEHAGKALIRVVSLLVCCNIVVGLIDMTGIGVKIGFEITKVGGESQIAALLLAALVAMIMGMGITTTGAYIVALAVGGTALVQLGFIPLAAHLFLFYWALMADITPPVCPTAYVGAAIANCHWMGVAKVAVRLSVVKYILPFFFILSPTLILMGNPFEILVAVASASFGAILISAGIAGYLTTELNVVTRISFFASGFLLLLPGWTTDVCGIAVLAVTLLGVKVIRLVYKGKQV